MPSGETWRAAVDKEECMRFRKWDSELHVVDGGIAPIGNTGWFYPTMRSATFWEKLRYSLGLTLHGPVWREVPNQQQASQGVVDPEAPHQQEEHIDEKGENHR
jgi:hypothetical protein